MKKRKEQADRIWQAGVAFALLLLLCGCTRKEELMLLTEETTEAAEDTGQEAYPQGENGRVSEEAGQHTPDGGNGSSERSSEAQPGVVYVHVCGAVARPGVYELEAGSRVFEAVEQAGGFAKDADQNYVNQACVLEDGVKLVIPTREEAAAAGERETASASGRLQEGVSDQIGIMRDGTAEGLGIVNGASLYGQEGEKSGAAAGRVNINTASEAQLCEIPGIGATRAAAIAAYRESHGAFEKPEDIMKVNGIKEGMYEKIKDSISVK